MKSSIRKQFAWIFIGLMTGTVLLCLFINNVFLERFYLHSKIRIIQEAYDSIQDAANSDSYGTTQFQHAIDAVCIQNNLSLYIMDVDSRSVYVSGNRGADLEMRLIGYVYGLLTENRTVLDRGEDYVLQLAGGEGNDYLEMVGRLNSGISFIMSTPVESIRQSALLANRFFIYVGCLGTILGAFIIWLVSRRITKPILELSRISERMVHLDFEARYKGGSENEIDLLGENINKLSASLEKSVSDLKTANNELQRDIEKREQIDEMRKEFLSNVSHELKTPIALIQGYAEGLLENVTEDPESQRYYCEVIVDEASKMNHMVRKLLTLNQLEFGNDVINLERVDLVSVIRGYVQSASVLAAADGIQIRMKEMEPVYVWADAYKVEEVFMNYFTNAIHHCSGERWIEVKIENLDENVRVSVFNTGTPIPEEAMEHIWEKFYKVDKARTREYGGSGIGLSIVKAIMESMNQNFGASAFPNGMLFWFDLESAED